MEVETIESEYVMVKIPSTRDNNSVALEWVRCMMGDATKDRDRKRRMEKAPPSLLKGEKGIRNLEYYQPAVVSLGPYHHNHHRSGGLSEAAEKYKRVTLKEYRSGTGKSVDEFYNKVFEVVHEARECYIPGSTDAYNDEEFNRMMLRDGCFILFFIECMACGDIRMTLLDEHLGKIEFSNVMRDILLLENQIPFVVLEVLLNLKFPEDKGEDILNGFFNFLNHGGVDRSDVKKVLEYKQPLHLLELYRSYFISPSLENVSVSLKKLDSEEDYSYVARNRWFGSATELKAKWIFLDQSKDEDMKFNAYHWHGEFKIARRALSSYTKAIYLNMIAYEMCPRNPNDFRISTYIRVMKALIIHEKDVKELRDKNVLIHGLGRDGEVVKMFNEIDVPTANLFMFNQLRQKIAKHHKTNFKTWVAELITDYFGSPWKVLGLMVGAAILVTSFVQTYFAIKPHRNE